MSRAPEPRHLRSPVSRSQLYVAPIRQIAAPMACRPHIQATESINPFPQPGSATSSKGLRRCWPEPCVRVAQPTLQAHTQASEKVYLCRTAPKTNLIADMAVASFGFEMIY